MNDAEALADRLHLSPIELVIGTLAHQSPSPSKFEERLRSLPRPALLRIARTWAAEPQNFSADPANIRRFDDFRKLAVAKTEEWQRPIRELGNELAAQFAGYRSLINESLQIQEQLQRIVASAAVVNRATEALREVGQSVANAIGQVLPDPLILLEAFEEAEKGKDLLDRHGYGFAIGDWGIATLRRIAREQPESRELHRAFLTLTRSGDFSQRFLNHFQADGRLRRRHPVMAAALQAHLNRTYALSVPVLYAQLEGVLTDLLISEGLAYRRGAKAYKPRSHKELQGLRIKAKRYGQKATRLRTFVTTRILEELTPDRNGVLHGMKVGYAQAHRSARLLLLIDVFAAAIVRGERAS